MTRGSAGETKGTAQLSASELVGTSRDRPRSEMMPCDSTRVSGYLRSTLFHRLCAALQTQMYKTFPCLRSAHHLCVLTNCYEPRLMHASVLCIDNH